MSKVRDLSGQRFGRLLVLNRAENTESGQARWVCQCDCGNVKTIRGTHLTTGKIISCGCYNKAVCTKHGMSGTPEYRTYYNMIKRCEYKNDVSYAEYGGRGIRVCPRWRSSFLNFLADMGKRPTDRHSIDRIDVNGNYEPSNCRWAVVETQEHNKRVRKDSPVGVRGVVQSPNGNFIAQIYADGKSHRIGTYSSLEIATQERHFAENKYWGRG
ncbi:hypothetical protein LY85_0905 [Clostridium sp. KNHs216]|nr:hypothetical protein LY85_0905 [Clostridium sp. KNHs216]